MEFQDVDKENIDGNLLHDISLLDPQISSTKGAPKRIKKEIKKCNITILNTKLRKVSLYIYVVNDTFQL